MVQNYKFYKVKVINLCLLSRTCNGTHQAWRDVDGAVIPLAGFWTWTKRKDKRPSGVKHLWTLQEATYQLSWLQFGRSDPNGQGGKEMIDSETQLEAELSAPNSCEFRKIEEWYLQESEPRRDLEV